jgi:hypothetical protein
MRFSPNSILTEAAEGIQVHRGTAMCDTLGERAFAMAAGTAVMAAADGSEAVALGMGSRAIARSPGARAIADGQDTSAQAYGEGAIAIGINGGIARAFEGATIHVA